MLPRVRGKGKAHSAVLGEVYARPATVTITGSQECLTALARWTEATQEEPLAKALSWEGRA